MKGCVMIFSALAILTVGLLLYFGLANIVDGLVFRAAMGTGDPFNDAVDRTDEAAMLAAMGRRFFIINVVRPTILTLIVFGGGAVTVGFLHLPLVGAVLAGVWFFFLTQHACLTGRTGASLNQAGWGMVVTIAAIITVHIAVVGAR
jgi:hypothetical protein